MYIRRTLIPSHSSHSPVSLPNSFHAALFRAMFLLAPIMPRGGIKFPPTLGAFSFLKNKMRASYVGVMQFPMLVVTNYLKILQSIVSSDSINVMNVLFWGKFSSKMLGHDVSMLKNSTWLSKQRIVAYPKVNIAILALCATLPIMMIRASIHTLNNSVCSFYKFSHQMIVDFIASEVNA